MKKIFLSLLLLSGTAFFSIAQTQSGNISANTFTEHVLKTPQEKAEWQMRWYSEILNLTDEQKKPIYEPVLKFEQEMAAANSNEEKMFAVLAQHLYMVQEFQNVLTYTQYMKYQQIDQYPDGYLNPNVH